MSLFCLRPESGFCSTRVYDFTIRAVCTEDSMWCPYLVIPRGDVLLMNTRGFLQMTYSFAMSRTQIDIDDGLLRKAYELTGLTSKRELVHRALELLVRFETRKGMIRYYGSGIWNCELKGIRKNRVNRSGRKGR